MKTIKELRKENNITPPQMAKRLGMALSTYFDKEAGRRMFKPNEIVMVCVMFNVRVEDIENFRSKNTQLESKCKGDTFSCAILDK